MTLKLYTKIYIPQHFCSKSSKLSLLPGLGFSDPGQRAASLSTGDAHHAGRKGSLQVSTIKVQSKHGWWRHVQLQQHYVLSLKRQINPRSWSHIEIYSSVHFRFGHFDHWPGIYMVRQSLWQQKSGHNGWVVSCIPQQTGVSSGPELVHWEEDIGIRDLFYIQS